MMLKYICGIGALLLLTLSGCGIASKLDDQRSIRDVYVYSRDEIVPDELRASVGEEIRWHNELPDPIYLAFLGVKPIKEVGCGKGFKTLFGEIKDIVTIRSGEYVSICFNQIGAVRYNVWTNFSDPTRSMSPTAIIHLEDAA